MKKIDVSKVELEHLEKYLTDRKLTFVSDATTDVKLAIYLRHTSAEIKAGAEPYICDSCNAQFAGPLPTCPVCGEPTEIEIEVHGEEILKNDDPQRIGTTKDLDVTVRNIRAATVSLATNYYRIGRELTVLLTSKLYKKRLDPKTKKPLYSSFKEFCKAELGFTAKTVRNMIAIAGAFDQETILKHGAEKLTFVARVPEEDRDAVLKRAEGMSSREVQEHVRKLFPGARRPALPGARATPTSKPGRRNGAVPSATPTPKADRVTVASVPNEPVKVKLTRSKNSALLVGSEPALNGVRIDYSVDMARMTLTVTRVRA